MINQQVLVTGGAGFIGSHVCEKLLNSDFQVLCIDNLDSYYDPRIKKKNIESLLKRKNFKFYKNDICDTESMVKIFKDHKIDKVIHLAGLAGVRASIDNPGEYVRVNLQGTVNLLDLARNFKIENFVLASTSSVYGAADQIPFLEDFATDKPLAPYPATKKAAELMAYTYHNLYKMNITCLRFFTAYGPRVRPDMMSYIVMDRMVKRRAITLFDNLKLKRDWTYIDDVCGGILAANKNPLGYEIINIGRGEPVLLTDFISILEKITGLKAKINNVVTPKSEPEVTFADISKAKRLLGYSPSIHLTEGLEKTWEWYKKQNKI